MIGKISDLFFCKQKTAYEMRISDWSSDVCSSDLWPKCGVFFEQRLFAGVSTDRPQTFVASQTSDFENMRPDSYVSTAVAVEADDAIGRAWCRERVCQYV